MVTHFGEWYNVLREWESGRRRGELGSTIHSDLVPKLGWSHFKLRFETEWLSLHIK